MSIWTRIADALAALAKGEPLSVVFDRLRGTAAPEQSVGFTIAVLALVGRLDGEIAPEIKATLAAARQTFATAEQTMANQSPLQQELQGSLREVSRAAQSVRDVMDYLDRHPEALLRGKIEEKAQ